MKNGVQLTILSFICFVAFALGQFAIDYGNDTFTMDGQPFRYISGSFHYFRSPSQYWRDRLQKMRQAGLNAVSTYVEWSLHEKIPGVYDFSGDLNVTNFIRIAREEGLYVILRPGPYICAERDMGGLPYWLLQKHPDIRLRTSDERYQKYVKIWLDVLMPEMKPLLYGNGGPIILVQIENEYGSYYACDKDHLIWLRDLFTGHVGNNAVLFTTDGGATSYLKCGKIPGVYATVDFGPGFDISSAFGAQRAYEPRGPLVNSEFYPGWLTHWGEPLALVQTDSVVKTFKEMLDAGANVNFYMFYGGTNFGFTAGANYGTTYQADLTSYDYDAPLTEGGYITPKYEAIQRTIAQYTPGMSISPRPVKQARGDYGEVILKRVANLLSPRLRSEMGKTILNSPLKTFEAVGQNYGSLLYETVSSVERRGSTSLVISQLNDRGIVFVNGVQNGILDREAKTTTTSINISQGDALGVFVDNLGRINYGSFLNDSKGILSDVLLNNETLSVWNLTSFDFEDVSPVLSCLDDDTNCLNGDSLIFYAARFQMPNTTNDEYLSETYLNVRNLTKGIAFVNGFNLGRYWSTRGPQWSLYVPGTILKKTPQENTLVVLDENINLQTVTLQFSPIPIWNTAAIKIKMFG